MTIDEKSGVLQNEYTSFRGDVLVPGDQDSSVIQNLLNVATDLVAGSAEVHAVGIVVEYDRKGYPTLDSVSTTNTYSSKSDDIYVLVEYKLPGYSPANKKVREIIDERDAENRRKELEAARVKLQNQRAVLEEELRKANEELEKLSPAKEVEVAPVQKRVKTEILRQFLEYEGLGEGEAPVKIGGFRYADILADGFDDHDEPQFKLRLFHEREAQVFDFVFQRNSEGYNSMDEWTTIDGLSVNG